MKRLIPGFFLLCVLFGTGSGFTETFPAWSFGMKIRPFDILYPTTTEAEIDARLQAISEEGADTTIVYIEEEHMYGSFVDETGFENIRRLLAHLTGEAHRQNLRVIVYVNGLEVMTHDAYDPDCTPRGIPSMFSEHSDWMQLDLDRQPIMYSCIDQEWLTPDMEDAWVSPFSPYRDLFKERITALGEAGVDGVYIDAVFMPGLQLDEENPRWGSFDPASETAFFEATGLELPEDEDWSDPVWREWLLWRHEALREYLGELASAAWTAGMVPFWESSTNDTDTGTLLGNETAVTFANPMGFSPEIEPEGDLAAAIRMFNSARDFAPSHPLIYLGWPENEREAREQMAVALSYSGTLYPTADGPYPEDVFSFADSIRSGVLEKRTPHWGKIALIYSVRNKDFTWEDSTFFEAYDEAYRELLAAHLPFRILVLEDLTPAALGGFEAVILPSVISMSDTEHELLDQKQVLLRGDVGRRDERWTLRESPLSWSHLLTGDIEDMDSDFPFEINAPETISFSFFDDPDGGWFLFILPGKTGDAAIVVSSDDALDATFYRPGFQAEELHGKLLTLFGLDQLGVLHIKSRESALPVIDDGTVRVEIDEEMRLQLALLRGDAETTIVRPSHAFDMISAGGNLCGFRILDSGQQQLNSVFGTGTRYLITAEARTARNEPIGVELKIDSYIRYPGALLMQATFRNNGDTTIHLDQLWSAAFDLDRRLALPGAQPWDFKMLSMGTIWGNGERDRIWSLAADSSFENYNGGDVTNPEFEDEGHWGGGGTPLTTIWGREMALTIAVPAADIDILAVPVATSADGTVHTGILRTADLPKLAPGQSLTTPTSLIVVHTGDFFDGVATYGSMMRDLGALPETYSTAADYEPYWCSFGLDNWRDESPADPDLVNELLYIPEDLGLDWINIDSGWENLGSCTVNDDQFDDDEEFVDFIASLHARGFKVSVWIDVGFGNDEAVAEHPSWYIRNADGRLFTDAWERHAMDPTIPEVRDFVQDCVTRMVTPQDRGGWGIDRFFVDGAFLVPPDASGTHDSPHDTERAGDILYRIVHDTARSIVPGFPIECCGSGGVTNVWIQRWATNASISDPDHIELRTHEIRTKLNRALFGARSAVNGDHIEGTSGEEHLDMHYLFPLQFGLGNVFQTYFWETRWRHDDPLGLGDEELYREWFSRYDQLRLSEGEYLNLYDLAHDRPGSHAILKDGVIYYLFAPMYGESFSGDIELRGLVSGRSYEVVNTVTLESLGFFSGPVITLNVTIPINRPLLLKAVEIRGPREADGRARP